MEEKNNEVQEKEFRPKYSNYMLEIAQRVNDKYIDSYLLNLKENRGWNGDSWGKDGWAGDWSGDSTPWSGDSWNKSTS